VCCARSLLLHALFSPAASSWADNFRLLVLADAKPVAWNGVSSLARATALAEARTGVVDI
tara:strand:+ start:255 stop:434 length:180 start_codon:yes stop_codon:yes gene_type:complete